MAGYIEDRWLTKRPDPETGERRRTALYGKGMRYKVAGIPGVRARSFHKKGDALSWKAKAEHEQRQAEFVDPRLGQITLGEYITEYWLPARAGGDPSTADTVRHRLTHITSRLGSMQLNAIRAPQLRTFVAELSKHLAAETVHQVWGCLSSVLHAAVDDERIRKNPCAAKTIKLPVIPERKIVPWSRERICAVRDALPARWRAMVEVGAAAGLRQGEAFGLAVEDIDEEAQVLHVRRQIRRVGSGGAFALPKGGKTRDVPVPPYLLALLREHMEAHPPEKVTLPWTSPLPPQTEKETRERAPRTHELVFSASRGGPLRKETWNLRHWKPALASAGVIPPPVPVRHGQRAAARYEGTSGHGFHVLRHTFASVQLDAREPVVAVSAWLGHADPSITLRIYAHLLPEADGQGREAMQQWLTRG